MKKQGILNANIACVVASMGHTELIGIVDAGFPIPDSTTRIDTAIKPGLPPFMDVLENILSELSIEEIIIADEMLTQNPALYERLMEVCPDIKLTTMPHEQFKSQSARCKAIVRTGECMPYANIMLRAGVIF